MRLALIPLFLALCAALSLVLSFLCLFAGDKPGFMEDYHILTLNTSRIGQNIANEGGDIFSDILPDDWEDDISSTLSNAVSSFAAKVGLEDWYSAHILDYCTGSYTPAPISNETVSQSSIHKNVTDCSSVEAFYHFSPTEVLQASLNASGLNDTVTLDDLDWPSDIEDGVRALKYASQAVFILYCIAIGLCFFSLIFATMAIFGPGRGISCVSILVAILAFLALALVSSIVTALIVKATHVINKYGNGIGVEAHRGDKFMAITWAATGVMMISLAGWIGECCFPNFGRQRARRVNFSEKPVDFI